MIAATITLDVLLAPGALLALLLNGLKTCSFLLGSIAVLHARLVHFTRFSFVPGLVAGHTRLRAAFVAGANVESGDSILLALLLI